jgi:hypothetical protein
MAASHAGGNDGGGYPWQRGMRRPSLCRPHPDPEPHKFYGQSIFDKTKDIQEIKTALIRGILDSTYLANAPRIGAVDGQVNMDDLLDSRPGGVVRMKNPDSIVPIPSTLVSDAAMNVVSYIDNVKEKRTGISQAGAGLTRIF